MNKIPDFSSNSNFTDSSPNIGILFVNKEIAQLFSELLSSRGIFASKLSDPSEIAKYGKVITEPCYIDHLDLRQLSKSLIVTSCENSCIPNIRQLTRPLTEKKVESALNFILSDFE